EEAPRFDADEELRTVGFEGVIESPHRRLPSPGMREERRDVVEQDAGLGEIRHRPDMLLEVHPLLLRARRASPARHSNGTEPWRKRHFADSRQDGITV